MSSWNSVPTPVTLQRTDGDDRDEDSPRRRSARGSAFRVRKWITRLWISVCIARASLPRIAPSHHWAATAVCLYWPHCCVVLASNGAFILEARSSQPQTPSARRHVAVPCVGLRRRPSAMRAPGVLLPWCVRATHGCLRDWLEHLERAHEVLVDGHHRARVVEFSTVIGRREYLRHQTGKKTV